MNKYPSRYSPGKQVTPAQFITELICEKKAYQDSSELPEQYWHIPKWAKYFRNQIAVANQLVKKYPADQVIRALQRIDAKTIYSLRNPYLITLIEKEKKELPVELHKPNLSSITEKPKRQEKESRLSRLRKLQDGL